MRCKFNNCFINQTCFFFRKRFLSSTAIVYFVLSISNFEVKFPVSVRVYFFTIRPPAILSLFDLLPSIRVSVHDHLKFIIFKDIFKFFHVDEWFGIFFNSTQNFQKEQSSFNCDHFSGVLPKDHKHFHSFLIFFWFFFYFN